MSYTSAVDLLVSHQLMTSLRNRDML